MNTRAILASPLGFLIGLSLGALGGGGSILAVPALVYGAGQSPKAATTTSLILVAITSLIGIVPHLRAGRVRVLAGTLFGLAGVGGSLLGSNWNESVDPDVLLLAFSVLMLVAAFAMCQRTCDILRRRTGTPPATGAAAPSRTVVRADARTVVTVIAAGTVVGLLTGFFGVGGGFVIVPALVLVLGFTMPEAVGTSLLVITINSVVALATRLQAGAIEWDVVLPFTIASLGGVIVGSRLAGSSDSGVLQRWFVGLMVAIAVYTGIRSGLAIVHSS
ncbi:MAG: sulfite exporter TauE/SafE family protein [Actinobacteria bacterium]|nr:sulfite exporter TauE/SafE family protein [Actinomycetota bacterium]